MLLARMAEAVYWAGRYLERAECTARIVQVHTDTHVDMPIGQDVGWEPLLAIAGVDGEFAEHYPSAARDRRRRRPPRRTSSSSSSTARTTRPPSWRGLGLGPREPPDRTAGRPPRGLGGVQRPVAGLLRRPRRGRHAARVGSGGSAGSSPDCQRINGVLLGTMSRDEAMSFLAIGQNLERADLTTRVLDVRSESLQPNRGDDPYDAVHWMAVLRSLAAYQPFRRAMPARPQGGSTLRFLLQDDRFPRAVSACLTEARVPAEGPGPLRGRPSTPAPTPRSWWRRRR